MSIHIYMYDYKVNIMQFDEEIVYENVMKNK